MATPPGKLPHRLKAGYGVVELGISAIETFIQLYLLKFYTDVVKLAPEAAGLALALAIIWDAVTDPAMGAISDQTRWRWGKRLPYILAGAPILALGVILLFGTPDLDTQADKFWYLLGTYMLVNTGMTVVAVPHAALGGELSPRLDERTEIFGWRFLFTNLGLLLAVLVPLLVTVRIGDASAAGAIVENNSVASRYIAISVLISAFVTVWAVRGADPPSSEARFSLREYARSLRSVLANRPFMILFLAYVFGFIGRTINAAVALYYYQYRLLVPEAQALFAVLLPFFLVIVLSIVGWLWVAQRFGKKWPAFWGVFLLGMMTSVVYPLLPERNLELLLVISIVGGIMAGSIFLLDSTVADIVDYDELKTRSHREGLYFGFWRMGTKFARAAGMALTGTLLAVIGFDVAAPTQSANTSWGLALIFGPGVGILFIIAAVIFAFMPLDRATLLRIRRILDQRNALRKQRSQAQ